MLIDLEASNIRVIKLRHQRSQFRLLQIKIMSKLKVGKSYFYRTCLSALYFLAQRCSALSPRVMNGAVFSVA